MTAIWEKWKMKEKTQRKNHYDISSAYVYEYLGKS